MLVLVVSIPPPYGVCQVFFVRKNLQAIFRKFSGIFQKRPLISKMSRVQESLSLKVIFAQDMSRNFFGVFFLPARLAAKRAGRQGNFTRYGSAPTETSRSFVKAEVGADERPRLLIYRTRYE